MNTEPLQEYNNKIEPFRQAVRTSSALKALLDPTVEPRVLHRFLIEYCSQGVQITQPVEGWIRRAGERCIELGLEKTGKLLVEHARHEADHHLMFIEDTKKLVDSWNQKYTPKLKAEDLLNRRATPAMQRYVDLHESNIAGTTPYAQVAIEYEIEGLSVSVLPQMLDNFRAILGSGVLESLSFLTEHAALDVGHTALNRRILTTLLADKPASCGSLVEAGAEALSSYTDFFGECISTSLSN